MEERQPVANRRQDAKRAGNAGKFPPKALRPKKFLEKGGRSGGIGGMLLIVDRTGMSVTCTSTCTLYTLLHPLQPITLYVP